MRKLTIILTVIAVIFSSVFPVYAYQDSYIEFSKTDLFEFSDNFDKYTAAMYSGSGVSLDSNWRTSNSTETDSSILGVARGFGNGELKVATNTKYPQLKYTTSNHLYIPAVVFTGDKASLAKEQLIKITAQKSHQSDMWGVRFYVHNGKDDTLNYYTLFFAGMYTTGYNTQTNKGTSITYGLYKCTDGTVTTLKERERVSGQGLDSVDGYMGTGKADLTISVIDGIISWTLNYVNGDVSYSYTDTYTDARPFEVNGSDTTVHLYGAGSDDPNRFIKFDNFTLASAVPYITSGEPDNVMYYNIAEGKSADNNGILDLGKSVKVRKLLYDGQVSDFKVLVSNDKTIWYRLADVSEFKNGKFLNTVTNDVFRYITAGDITNYLTVLTDITEYTGVYTDSALRLYPRVGGVDYFSQNDNKLSSSDTEISVVNGNLVSPAGIGTCVLTATDGINSTQINLTFKNGIYSYQDSFDNMGTVNYTGANVQFNKAWRSKLASEGKMGYNDDATIGYHANRIFVQARGATEGDSMSRYPRWAETVPAAVFNADHADITRNQIIKLKLSKTSGTETSGVRFMVHDNGNSYYALIFPGMYGLGGLTDKDTGNSSWELIKCEGGQYTMLDRKVRESNSHDVAGGFLSRGEGQLTIEYVDGRISWNMDVYKDGNKVFTWSDEYTDEKPYTLSGNDSTVWLISGLYSGDTPSRGTYFDDIQIASYVPYITADEPSTVLYKNLINNKTADNGIYALDTAQSIRRIIAQGVQGTLKVYASKDNNIWYKLSSFTNNGDFLNNVYGDKFSFIKTEGTGTVSVLGEINENDSINIMPGDTLTLYPYIDGTLYQNPQITEETGCVSIAKNTLTAKAAIKNDTVSVKCGSIELPFKVTVPLLSAVCGVTPSGNDAVVEINVPGFKNIDCKIAVIFFNADHSMNSVQYFDADFSDETETITVEDYYTKGSLAKLVIWDNTDKATAYTKAVKLARSR